MKKLIPLFFLFITVASFAQDDERNKSMLIVSGGLSFPTGDYADDDLESESSGLAKLGGYGEIGYFNKIKEKNWGFTLGVRLNSNPIDLDKLKDELEGLTDTEWSVGKASYKTTSFNIGLFVEDDITDNTVVRFRGAIGYAISKFPDMAYETSAFGSSFNVDVKGGEASNICVLLGAALRFKMSDKIGLILEADYFSTKPEFQTTTTATFDGDTEVSSTEIDQSISTIGLGLGIAFMLK
jgi:hypothetical protein